mgnify:CR=1 FL=1
MRKNQRGSGPRAKKILAFLKKANAWLRRTKLASKTARWYGQSNLPYASQVGKAGEIAAQLGYGLKLAGGRKCKKYCRRRTMRLH